MPQSRSSSPAMCTFAAGTYLDLLAVSRPTFESYAKRWRWKLIVESDPALADGRPLPWAKIALLRRELEQHDLVLWVDADALILRPDQDIRTVLVPNKHLYLTTDMNSGVMLFDRSDWTSDFLRAVWEFEEVVNHKYWENEAIRRLLGWGRKRKRKSPWDPGTQFISDVWNSTTKNEHPNPVIKHYAGRGKTESRIRLMQGDRPAAPTGGVLRARSELPELLNELGLLGVGVEIGVQRGLFSEEILTSWRGRKLISVDPWLADPDYHDRANVSQEEQDALYKETRKRLAPFGGRSEIWRTTSLEAADRIEAESLDFAYIDARHDEESVMEDLALWAPKVRPGGILAGHDYLDRKFARSTFGVKAAVDRFLSGRVIHVTREKFPTWLVRL